LKTQPEKERKKLHIEKGLRLQIYAWGIIVGIVLLIGTGGTFAWYTLQEREADTETANVVKPYYLTLLNPSETDMVQLSIGSLQQGKAKQIVFCVSNKGNTQINTDNSPFEYALELIHTDNLVLNYEIYPLESAESDESGVIVAEDMVTDNEGNTTITTTYWKKSGSALTGTDVSATRHEQLALTDTQDIINRGTYISYGKVEPDGNDVVAIDNNLVLDPGDEEYASAYFVMEISWNIVSGFEKYEKETDLIYILATAIQPEPEIQTESP